MSEVDGHLSDGLHRIGVKKDALAVDDGGDLFDWEEHPGLIVGPHRRDNRRVAAHCGIKFAQVDPALRVHSQPCHLDSPLGQPLAMFGDRAVLDARGDHVLAVRIQRQRGVDRGVVRLRAATGKKDFPRLASQQGRHLVPRPLDGLGRALAKPVGARWIAILLGQVGHHRLHHRGIGFGRGVVVQIDE